LDGFLQPLSPGIRISALYARDILQAAPGRPYVKKLKHHRLKPEYLRTAALAVRSKLRLPRLKPKVS